MSAYGNVVYTVSGLDYAVSDIVHSFANHIAFKFPQGTFKEGSVIVDTQGLITDVKRRENGLDNPERLVKPYVTVSINNGLPDQWNQEDNGPIVRQYSMFPGTTTDRRLVSNHRLGMVSDLKKGILIDTIDFRRKLDLTFKFVLATKSDLNTMKSAMYNIVSLRKANRLVNVKAKMILPNILVSDVSKLAFDKSTFHLTDQVCLDKLTKYFNDNGMYNFSQGVSDVDENNIWYYFERLFKINYFAEIVDGKDGDNGDKVNDAIDNFSFEMNCSLDFKMPNSYIMNYKAFNAPNKIVVDNIYFKSVKPDLKGAYPVEFSRTRFIEDRDCVIPPISNYCELISREEFFITTPAESVQVSQFIPKDSTFWYALERLTPEERTNLFDMQVYENTTYIGPDEYTIDNCPSDVVFNIINCDVTVSYQMYLYCDMLLMKRLFPLIIDRIRKGIYPNVGPDGKPYAVGSYPPSTDSGAEGSGGALLDFSFGSGNYAMARGNHIIGGNDITGNGGRTGSGRSMSNTIKTFDGTITANRGKL